MSCTANRFDAETIDLTSTKTSVSRSRRSKRAIRTAQADRTRKAAFDVFAAALRADLAPQGSLEAIYAERAIVAAWRLREAVEAERTGVLDRLGIDSADLFGHLADDLRRQADRAGRSLRGTLDLLLEIRGIARTAWGQAAPLDTTLPAGDSETTEDEGLVIPDNVHVPADDVDDYLPADEPAIDDAPLPRWQDRLIFEENVSEDSPVVRGTWITVSQVVTLIVDGYTWADILRSHPELTEDDIRVCLAFAHEQEDDDSRGIYLA